MPKTDIALHLLVMIRTFSAKPRDLRRSLIGVSARAVVRVCGGVRVARGSLASEAGDTLIEVLISALLVGLIVVGTLTGFNVTSGASATERARAQADALAQQAEERLRSMSLAKLEALQVEPLVEEVTQNGTKYKITSTAEYRPEEGTASCNSTSTNAGYYRTSSTVTGAWQSAKSPVVETGIISPPPGSALIVQVTGATGEGVGGMTVTAAGPAPAVTPHTLSTVTNGCAILALLPGEYAINVSRAGYVDENWYPESKEDPHSTRTVYLVAETAIKESYRFAQAGTLEVKFNGSKPEEGDSFVASNIGMKSPAFRAIPSPSTLETYKPTITSEAKVFPFAGEGGKYAVYAGTCESDNPKEVNPENKVETVTVPSGLIGKVTVTQPPINIKVMSGKEKVAGKEGKAIENATVTLTDVGEGCEEVRRTFKTNSKGELSRPGAPFGEYSLCVTGGKEGGNNGATKGLAKERKYTTTFENDKPAGPSKLAAMTNGGVETVEGTKFAVIYMEAGAAEKPLGQPKPGETCP
jgi:type II secretory pathway pseudopilin PulG